MGVLGRRGGCLLLLPPGSTLPRRPLLTSSGTTKPAAPALASAAAAAEARLAISLAIQSTPLAQTALSLSLCGQINALSAALSLAVCARVRAR